MRTAKRQLIGKAIGMSEKWAEVQMVAVNDIQVCKISTQPLTWALLGFIKSLNYSSIIETSCWMLPSGRICLTGLDSLSFLP